MTNLNAKGLASAYISGEQDDKNIDQMSVKVVFFTLEVLLLKKKWQDLSPYIDCLCATVVDEAHTIKKWGEHFKVF